MKKIPSLLARISFAITIIVVPMRWRILLMARPNLPVYGDYTDFLLFASDIAILSTLIFWGLSFFFQPRTIILGPTHLWASVLGLTVASWLSVIASWDISLSIYHAIRLSLLFLFSLFIVNEIRSPVWVVVPASLGLTLQSIIAIGQSVSQHDIGLQLLGEYKLDPAWYGISVLESADGFRFLRAYGLSDHPNILGGCLAFGLIILLAAFLNTKWKWPLALAFILSFVAMLLTFSRSAWAAFSFGTLIILLAEWMKLNKSALIHAAILLTACLCASAAFIFNDLSYFGGRFNMGNSFTENRVEHGSIIEREYLLEKSNTIFTDHPLTGVGLGASAIALKAIYPEFPLNYQPPHLTLAEAALETGLIGAVFYFLLLILPLMVFWINRKNFVQDSVIIACLALQLAVSTVGLFDYYTWLLAPGRIWQWAAWGVWAAALEKHKHAMD